MSIKRISKRNTGGFTLIEMLVSVALFTVVLTVTLGAILTIVDANRKARSLMSVMGNLNFAVDAITRSVKTGTGVSTSDGGKCVSTTQIDYDGSSGPVGTEVVEYCLVAGTGVLTKQVGTSAPLNLMSGDVYIDDLIFVVAGNGRGSQPKLSIRMKGTVQVSARVSSSFVIQTSVSQRQLNF